VFTTEYFSDPKVMLR